MNKNTRDFLSLILLAVAISLPLSFIKTSKEVYKNDYKKIEAIEEKEIASYEKEKHVNNVKPEILPNNVVEIKLNSMKELSGLSVKQILALRKNAVKNSTLFSKMDYSPSSQVIS